MSRRKIVSMINLQQSKILGFYRACMKAKKYWDFSKLLQNKVNEIIFIPATIKSKDDQQDTLTFTALIFPK